MLLSDANPLVRLPSAIPSADSYNVLSCGDCLHIVGDNDDPIIIITMCNNDDDRNDDHVTKMMNVFKRGSVGNKCGHKPRARS